MRDPMNVDLHQLRIFVAVARLGNFTRAAERLGLSQPSLSLHVRQLERDLRVRLFDRSTRSVALTRAGDDFLPIAERPLDDFQSAVAAVTDLAARRRGRGEVDFGLGAIDSVDADLSGSALISDELIAVLPPAHPWANASKTISAKKTS